MGHKPLSAYGILMFAAAVAAGYPGAITSTAGVQLLPTSQQP
jgi:UPF0716 family protein affecting phage T7 exclusion